MKCQVLHKENWDQIGNSDLPAPVQQGGRRQRLAEAKGIGYLPIEGGMNSQRKEELSNTIHILSVDRFGRRVAKHDDTMLSLSNMAFQLST